jgi:glycine/D-amino acid oxidase-like deaminating enzyme
MGVGFIPECVIAIQPTVSEPKGYLVSTTLRTIAADIVIVAAGIWNPRFSNASKLNCQSPQLRIRIYTTRPEIRDNAQPFVRWPKRHVCARDYGTKDGFGSYNHKAVACKPGRSALGQRLERYVFCHVGLNDADYRSGIIEKALEVFQEVKQMESKLPHKFFNGIFTVTPDGMPFAGYLSDSLYIGLAAWITHVAGVARLLAEIVTGIELDDEDIELKKAFNPKRFGDESQEFLKKRALATYNDIYNQKHLT